jgi:hypothetical protein
MSLFSHDDVFWTDACNKAHKQSAEALLVAAHGSCGVTVTRAGTASIAVYVHLFLHALITDIVDIRADCRILRLCSCEQYHDVPVVADGRGETAARVAAVRASLLPLR